MQLLRGWILSVGQLLHAGLAEQHLRKVFQFACMSSLQTAAAESTGLQWTHAGKLVHLLWAMLLLQ